MVKYDKETPVAGGILFDSLKEARRYVQLLELVRLGKISYLERQRRIKINVNGVAVCSYVCDFTYLENGRKIYEDVKSRMTIRLPLYILKKKLVRAAYGIEIRETV